MADVGELWADFGKPIRTAEDYIASLRGRRMNIFFMGERVPEPVDHPVIRPSGEAAPDAPGWNDCLS
jgi:4-hydroxybutyryl-CoA dehydratase/vinylacetyl-CoA-Delta-isomerase